MKITAINTWYSKEAHRNLIFIEVVTDEGINGVGEAYSVGPDETVAVTVKDFVSWLVGKDPRNIEGLWQEMYNFSRFPNGLAFMGAVSGIDIALWDIKGKAAGLPVWALLGGKCRTKIRAYGHVKGSTTAEMAASASEIVKKYGYTAIKCFPVMWPSEIPNWYTVLRHADERLRAIRGMVGMDVDVACDAHAAVDYPYQAVQLTEVVVPYHPLFLEEPIRPENMTALAEVRHKTTVPIATGEMFYNKWAYQELLSRGAADIIQPDICIVGGFTEMKKIAAVAETFYTPLAPHNPMGPVATAANVHLAAVIPNFLILEYIPDETAERLDVIDAPVPFRDGWLEIPDKPGLGIELVKDGLSKHPPAPWHRPFRYHKDGRPAVI